MSARIAQKILYQEVADRLCAMVFMGELKAGKWVDKIRLTGWPGILRSPFLRERSKAMDAQAQVVDGQLPRGAA